ncbi:endoplasmic reticulum-Golgi intermediate compartment protein 3-like isoform X2 [Ipomoea triloba]|uniref:endoplasmic reticulum-Golgi intermediate compartment protein 3-like isoform X2 n=1 Tax=Ipomoea triloba TaxID=35885 RepID=UPI00125DB3A4|nr:endoplasmic reticulum-Golgi intermediate compartment protein 3-like isoform X2 [Ipomoea triloba]
MDKVFNKLRNLDAYPKINEDFYNRTLSGGVITLVSSIVMLLLFFSEFRLYLHTVTETRLIVDNSIGEKLHINVEKPLQKHGGRLEHNETYCGTCFGAEMSDDDCCNSCEEVREAHIKRGI